jgi:hypothetical protein
MKMRPVGVELFHEDGWTDMMKLIVGFRGFVNSRKTNKTTGKMKQHVPKTKGILLENCIPLNSEI